MADVEDDIRRAKEIVAQWALHPLDPAGAFVRLIGHCERLMDLNAALAERVAAQASLLARRAERETAG